MVVTDPAEMPRNDPLVHYAGVGKDGKVVIWLSAELYQRGFAEKHETAFVEAQTGAMAVAAADLGLAGPSWKARVDRARDKPALAHMIGHAFSEYSRLQTQKSRTEIAWIRTNVPPGTMRSDVLVLLKGRKDDVVEDADAVSAHVAHSPLYVGFSLGFNLACGKSMQIKLTFDDADKLTGIEDQPERQDCL